jgi:hypothetical protein
MKGSAGIPALQLEVLNKLITTFDRAPTMFFSGLCNTVQAESDTIKWEIEYGSAGMTPFVAPGSIAPAIGLDGIGEGSAKAAFFKEKMYYDEVFLNNIRKPGTYATYQTSERKLSRGSRKLRNRIDRRREWMMAMMMTNGVLTYTHTGGTKFTISYGIPVNHQITLGSTRYWGTGASRDPIEDIFDAKTLLADDAGVIPNVIVLNSDLLKTLMLDAKIQALLWKSTFGNGDLFANPRQVIGTLLGVGDMQVYDELYEVTGWITGNVTGGTTTVISIDDATDFEIGGKLRFIDLSENNTYEDEVISAVDYAANTVTVATAPTASFKANEDKVIMRKKFIPDNMFLMLSTTSGDNEPIAEFMEAPYGVDRRWGMYADTKDEWDPEGLWLRVQDKGLPVLYHPDTIIQMKVKA